MHRPGNRGSSARATTILAEALNLDQAVHAQVVVPQEEAEAGEDS